MAFERLYAPDANKPCRIGLVSHIDRIPSLLEGLTHPFVLLLLLDATKLDSQELQEMGRMLIDHGLVYFCAWGPDCERVHDQVDFADRGRDPIVMTTWHANDLLGDAIWYFLNCAHPADDRGPGPFDYVAISVDNPEWFSLLRRSLQNPARLITRRSRRDRVSRCNR